MLVRLLCEWICASESLEKLWLTELLTNRSWDREGRENWPEEGRKSGFLAFGRLGKKKERIG